MIFNLVISRLQEDHDEDGFLCGGWNVITNELDQKPSTPPSFLKSALAVTMPAASAAMP